MAGVSVRRLSPGTEMALIGWMQMGDPLLKNFALNSDFLFTVTVQLLVSRRTQ